MLKHLRIYLSLFFLFISILYTGPLTLARTIDNDQHLSKRLNVSDTIHFLNRVAFGAEPNTFKKYFGKTRKAAINDVLLGIRTTPVTPLPKWTLDQAPPFWGRNDLSRSERNLFDTTRTKEFESLKRWWVNEIAQTDSPLTERLVLFWHNHFVAAYSGVNRWSISLIRQNQTFRKLGAASFKMLLTASLKDPALLNYLDNDKNRKGRPNENLGRELLELFTLGEGNFSERDVKEVSRSLTGWRIAVYKNLSFWDDNLGHDKGYKTVFGKRGRYSQEDIIELLLNHPKTSEFITEKFWKYFISETWQNKKVIKNIAKVFKESGSDVLVLLKQILGSTAFWSPKARGSIIKSPIDFVLGTVRSLRVSPRNFHLTPQILKNMGQEIFNPPNVGGWPGYSAWVTPSGIIERIKYVKDLTAEGGIISNPEKINNIKRYFKFVREGSRNLEQTNKIKYSNRGKNVFIADSMLTSYTRGFNSEKHPTISMGFINARVNQRFWQTLGVGFDVRKGRGLRIKFRGHKCHPECFKTSIIDPNTASRTNFRRHDLNIFLSDSPKRILRKLNNFPDDEKRMVAIIAGSLDVIADLIGDGRRYDRHQRTREWVSYLREQAPNFRKKRWIKSFVKNDYELKTTHGYQPPIKDMEIMTGGKTLVEGIMPGGFSPTRRLKGWKAANLKNFPVISLADYLLVVPEEFMGRKSDLQNILTSPAYNVR